MEVVFQNWIGPLRDLDKAVTIIKDRLKGDHAATWQDGFHLDRRRFELKKKIIDSKGWE